MFYKPLYTVIQTDLDFESLQLERFTLKVFSICK